MQVSGTLLSAFAESVSNDVPLRFVVGAPYSFSVAYNPFLCFVSLASNLSDVPTILLVQVHSNYFANAKFNKQ